MQESVKRAAKGEFIFEMIGSFVFSIAWMVLIFYKLRYQKTNKIVWIQIILLLSNSLINVAWSFASIAYKKDHDNSELEKVVVAIKIVLPVSYITQHWIFALSYLKVAIGFKLAFSVQNEEY